MIENASCSLGVIREMDGEANGHKKLTNVKCHMMKMDESSVPVLHDDPMEVQHLLEEPKPENISVDGVLCFGRNSSSKAPEVDFSDGLDCGLKKTRRNVQPLYDFEFGVLDGFLDDVDEVDDIHAANDISGACENFLLDVELAEHVSDLDFAPREAFYSANMSSESQSPGFSGSSSGANGLSESSTVTVPEHDYSHGQLVKCESHVLSGDKWRSACDFRNHDGFTDNVKPSLSIIDENEAEFVEATKGGTLLGPKRLRRKTKRYIEEFADPKSKHVSVNATLIPAISKDKFAKTIASDEEYHARASESVSSEETIRDIITEAASRSIDELLGTKLKTRTARFKNSVAVSKDRRLKKKSQNEHLHLKVVKCAAVEESHASGPQVQSESRSRRGRPRKCISLPVLESDDEQTSDSTDNRVKKKPKKGDDRRKHQRMWTLPEVNKLVDGVAEFGTGRWTDIKNRLFSSTAYRTPIDLRDKWRNLLRASNAQKQKRNKKEVEQKLKNHALPLSKTLERRICELASIHPYPRFTPGGRYTRRKN